MKALFSSKSELVVEAAMFYGMRSSLILFGVV
jgi:hypothetical protein